ncbi:hypothetical protein BDV96DRAFT_262966 [Lophiotrema nucula]|uniref:Uncharacterized protein n=1 Tax=Lophiotrema nucula TaxID=690887 RepID=A0A6A5YMW6_9PLEO|nr:hypothetical protein BDV96DRAFT_262966 [Lophiotrema nucula]
MILCFKNEKSCIRNDSSPLGSVVERITSKPHGYDKVISSILIVGTGLMFRFCCFWCCSAPGFGIFTRWWRSALASRVPMLLFIYVRRMAFRSGIRSVSSSRDREIDGFLSCSPAL